MLDALATCQFGALGHGSMVLTANFVIDLIPQFRLIGVAEDRATTSGSRNVERLVITIVGARGVHHLIP